MKRLLLIFLLISSSLSYANKKEPCVQECYNYSAEVRGALFIPQSGHLRDIYGAVWPDFGLQGQFLFDHWAAFLDIDFRFEEGSSQGLGTTTRARFFTFTGGPKYYFLPSAWISPYLGFGAGAAYIIFKDSSPFVNNIYKWGFWRRDHAKKITLCRLFCRL